MHHRSFQYVNHSQINKSKTKQAHAFGKSTRFLKTFQPSCSQHAYQLTKSMIFLSTKPSILNNKFPKQSRFKMSNLPIKAKTFIPSPHTYSLQSFVERNQLHKHGYKFGNKKRVENDKKNVPGPGAYQYQNYNPETNLSYTMRKKTHKDRTHWNKVGPGQYQLGSSFKPNGLEYNSQYESSRCSKLGKGKRFMTEKSDTPAPNRYQIERLRGSASKFFNSGIYSFGRSLRGNLSHKNETPGPGQYLQFSEFSEKPQNILSYSTHL